MIEPHTHDSQVLFYFMKELEKEFIGRGEVKGFRFTQIKQNQHAYIYQVDDDHGIRYEVFQRKINKKWECVSYPKSKSFGIWAWSCMSLEKAEDRFAEITTRRENL